MMPLGVHKLLKVSTGSNTQQKMAVCSLAEVVLALYCALVNRGTSKAAQS